ncbi:MAG: UDP-glucose 4-epimerase GalE [Phycisphaerales bacterium]
MSGKVLVTGAAGYIGSHAVKALLAGGRSVVGLDNMVRGTRGAVEALRGIDTDDRFTFVEGDISDRTLVPALLKEHDVREVIHFAALAYVGESMHEPIRYYTNNTVGSIHLITSCVECGVERFVFSSTCATYGEPEPDLIPIAESCPQSPINPYGASKLFIERVLEDVAADVHAKGNAFGVTMLRYFNVAGCDPDGVLGEDHTPETHLIPIVLQAALGKREAVTIFGDDYATPDGTCVRDYVHVTDLVRAHLMALEQLGAHDVRKLNLGVGCGYSVREIIEAVKRVTGKDFPVNMGARRPGDPPTLTSDASLAGEVLGWRPEFDELDRIIETAWAWFQRHPDGY